MSASYRMRTTSAARAEQGRADADMGRADRHRDLVIAGHAHAEAGDVMAPREFGKQGEIGRRLRVGGRNAHQARDRQAGASRMVEQAWEVGDGTAALLRLVADIDL